MIVKTTGLRKNYHQAGEDIAVLRDISLEMAKPETLAIMGRSGCGKSTLISLLAGLDTPSFGEIEILGHNLQSFSARELNQFRARHIGIVFQQFHLLEHLTALENVRLPLDLGHFSDSDSRALAELERVGLGHRKGHFPEQLSRGECQRVAIARVLVMKPPLLLADEPTGSLDVKTGGEVMDLLFHLVERENMALVMATHDAKVANRCARRMIMDEGRLLLNEDFPEREK